MILDHIKVLIQLKCAKIKFQLISCNERVAEDTQVGGTFDASGAFRDERWSDEEDPDGKKRAAGKKWTNETDSTTSDQDFKKTEVKEIIVDSPIERKPVENNHVVSPIYSFNSNVTFKTFISLPKAETASISPVRSVSAHVDERIADSNDPPTTIINDQQVPVEEDGLEHAQAVVSTLVAQLVEDEDQPKELPMPTHIPGMDQWFYR